MAVNENNSQINTFTGGMNTDTSYQMMESNQYLLAKNLRLYSLNGTNHVETTNAHGELRPIEGIAAQKNPLYTIDNGHEVEILATNTIRDIGIVIFRDKTTKEWGVLRCKNRIGEDGFKDDGLSEAVEARLIFGMSTGLNEDVRKLSTVVRYEDADNIKLYIADGKHSILVLNVADSADDYNANLNGDIDKIQSYPKIVFHRIEFLGFTSGSLKPSLVQYSYQLYNKNGVHSDISPATKLIPIVKSYNWNDGKRAYGIEQGVESNMGVRLKFVVGSEASYMSNILVYRITYEQNGQLPIIELIHDGKTTEEFEFIDDGKKALSLLTLEEYNAQSGVHIVPKVIESKNDYLFAANIKNIDYTEDMNEYLQNWDSRTFRFNRNGEAVVDGKVYNINTISQIENDADCIQEYNDMSKDFSFSKEVSERYFTTFTAPSDTNGNSKAQYWGGEGPEIEWRFVVGEIIGDSAKPGMSNVIAFDNAKSDSKIPFSFVKYEQVIVGSNRYWENSFEEVGPDWNIKQFDYQNETYADPSISYHLKSLRRNELYRYGIIFYDKFGNTTPVKWIGDIRTPNIYDDCFEAFSNKSFIGRYNQSIGLIVRPLGICFRLKNGLPEDIVSYEIVRCNRTSSDIMTVTQGVISRPIKKIINNASPENEKNTIYPYTPTGFLIANKFQTQYGNIYEYTQDSITMLANNYDNYSLIQFISPEYSYTPESVNLTINSSCKLSTLSYMYPDVSQAGDLKDEYLVIEDQAREHTFRLSYIGANLSFTETNLRYMHQIGAYYFYQNRIIDNNGDGSWMALSYAIPSKSIIGVFENDAKVAGVQVDGNNTIDVIKDVKKHQFGYIKLYNQMKYIKKPDDTQYNFSVPGNSVRIENSATSNIIGWDQALSGAGENTNRLYMQYIQNIGSDLYCNEITFGSYGNQYIDTSNQWAPSVFTQHWTDIFSHSKGRIPMAGGGKCAIMKLSDIWNGKNIFSDYRGGNSMQSFAGTYLCNIRTNNVPYFGQKLTDRKLSTYSSYGNLFEKNEVSGAIFDGDCYIMPFEYVSAHKQYAGEDVTTYLSFCIVYSIPVETSINLAYTHGYEFSKKALTDEYASNLQVEPGNVYNVFTQSDPLYAYNTAYSSNANSKTYAAENSEEEYNKTFDYRAMFSNPKTNDEQTDSWTTFQAANFLDADTRYGEITNMKTFHNELLFWQTGATGKFSVNERTSIVDEQNMPLLLGTGGVLNRYDYIDDTSGMHKEEFCDALSDSTLYWFDDDNQEIKMYQSGQRVLSLSKTKRIQNIMHQMSNINHAPTAFYDKRYNETIFNVINDNNTNLSVVYSEQSQQFMSLYDINFDGVFNFYNGQYLLRAVGNDIEIAQWNKVVDNKPHGWGDVLSTYIRYVVNKNVMVTKVYDNQEIVTVNKPYTDGLEGSTNLQDDDAYFSKHHNYTWATDLNGTKSALTDEITLREGNYRFAIPRAGNSIYGNRIRGKYMIASIEDTDPDYDSSISYIITKFRMSWS